MTDKLRAFTSSYNSISNRLVNNSTIRNEEKEITAKTLWDTGATISCISHSVVQDLQLAATGKREISTPSGGKEVNTYLVNVVLLNGVDIGDLEVCETENGNQGIDFLVGMDIINQGDLSVSNFDGRTVFTFSIPSMQTFDFAKQIKIHNLIGPTHGRGKRKRKK